MRDSEHRGNLLSTRAYRRISLVKRYSARITVRDGSVLAPYAGSPNICGLRSRSVLCATAQSVLYAGMNCAQHSARLVVFEGAWVSGKTVSRAKSVKVIFAEDTAVRARVSSFKVPRLVLIPQANGDDGQKAGRA